jgi:hypothetical protein
MWGLVAPAEVNVLVHAEGSVVGCLRPTPRTKQPGTLALCTRQLLVSKGISIVCSAADNAMTVKHLTRYRQFYHVLVGQCVNREQAFGPMRGVKSG